MLLSAKTTNLAMQEQDIRHTLVSLIHGNMPGDSEEEVLQQCETVASRVYKTPVTMLPKLLETIVYEGRVRVDHMRDMELHTQVISAVQEAAVSDEY